MIPMLAATLALVGCRGEGDPLTGEVRLPHPSGTGVIAYHPPRGWQAYVGEELPSEVAYFGPKAEGFNASLSVVFEQNDEKLTTYVDKLTTEQLPKLFSDLAVVRSDTVALSNIDAWQLVTRYQAGELELSCMRTIVDTAGWKISLTFTCLTRDFSDLEGLFQACVKSFRWLKEVQPVQVGRDESRSDEVQ